VRPTQQGAVYLWTIGVFSLTLLALGEDLVFLLGALALGCAAAAWVLARRNLRGVEVGRRVPRRMRAGSPATWTWTLRHAGRVTRMGLEVRDRASRGRRPLTLVVEVPSLAPGSEAAVPSRVALLPRGTHDLGRAVLTVESRWPLGLFRAAAEVRVAGQVLVRPLEGRATPALRKRLTGNRVPETRRRRLHRGEDQIYGVREFREGDDPRRIHWRSTARRGALVVSEWRAEEGREAVLLLGRSPGAGRPGAESAAFERAVSTAATVWRALAEARMEGRLLLGGRLEARLLTGGRGLEAGLDALARVRGQGRRRPRRALAALADRSGARTVVYVSCGDEPGVEAALAAAAGRGGRSLLLRSDRASLRRWVRGLP
jgi:uncharacterized protein (DUF58 family)